ncbi:MAG TPA: 3-oxo-tetronate 4-phosphate decarboxylase [Devosiaceae bacterium]|jgi:ribulose-5-phosphate 4-epimerase/fuculose-1-phosphate aldolase|nr:3-oxo-tetronate 4-phosphate decarboxylase [Devosiaceae bacterium]
MTTETDLRERLCLWGRSIFERGLTSGSSGNISVRLEDGFLITPTNSCLGLLDPARLAKLDPAGRPVSGDKPSKEVPLHLAYYQGRPAAGAVVHLHSTYATAWSCRADLDATDVFPPLTPYVLMRAGRVPLIPYSDPGTDAAVPHLLRHVPESAAVLIANHGPVVSGADLDSAVYAAEEVEEIAKLAFILIGQPTNRLPADVVRRLLDRGTK